MDIAIERTKRKYLLLPLYQNTKIATLKGWPTFDEEEANLLALKSIEKEGNYGIRLGKIGGLIVIDVDKLESENEPSFVKQARKECRMSTRTPHGHHLYFLYDSRFNDITRFRILYVDILANNTYAVGPGSRVENVEYVVERDEHPERMSDALFEEIMRMRSLHSRTRINLNLLRTTPSRDEISIKINEILKLDCEWIVSTLDNGAYKLVPKMKICLVKEDEIHSQEEHSCLIVHKTAVVAQCFSHNKLFISGTVSSKLRSLFFKSSNPVERIINDILTKAQDKCLVRKDGYVWKKNKEIPCLYEKLESIEYFAIEITKGDEALVKKPSILK